ncbi:MAG: hypothetical protein U0271_03980 [Polyangiaceae bacterium]
MQADNVSSISRSFPTHEVLPDKWTAVTVNGSLSAQFEHTLVVTRNGCEILTRRNRPLMNSEIFPASSAISAVV